MFDTAISNRYLILRLVRRELALKYAGSMLGAIWAVLTPLLMLLIYTGFFSVVMKTKWGGAGFESESFSLLLFAGLLVHFFYAEVLTGAPNLIVNNANYVKKTVFPIEVLAIVQTLTAAVGLLVNLLLLLVFVTIDHGLPPPTSLLSIAVLLPLFLVALGTSWLLSALGVYFRDISQLSGLLASILLFASPVFYPASALPEKFQILLYLNPLTFIIEQLRVVMLAGGMPNFSVLSVYYIGALLFCYGGFYCLKQVKSGFADVL